MATNNAAAKAVTKKRGSAAVPSKRTMNFVHHESSINWAKLSIVIVLIVIVCAVFVKLGFLDQLEKKTIAYNQLAMQQEQLSTVNARLAGYDELANMYGRYSYGWMNQTEVNMVSRMDVLQLVEEQIVPNAVVENLAVNNNVLTMNIHGITLAKASEMVKSLEATPLVASATVYTASAQNGEEASIFISITLQKEVN